MKFNVNCSLPRSGSELTQVLLSQHPAVYGSITSPLHAFWAGTHIEARNPELNGHGYPKTQQLRRAFIKAGTEGFYKDLTDKEVVVDKGRAWWDKMPLVWELWPEARMICCVRDVDDIVNSCEKRFQKDPMNPDFAGIPLDMAKRAEYWVSRPPVQSALGGLNYAQSTYSGDERFIQIPYKALISEPVKIMNQVFEAIGLEPYDVDADNVEKQVEELEGAFWPLGDHNVKKVVQ